MAYTYYDIAEFSGGLHSGRIGIEVDSQSIEGNYSIINIRLQVREDTNASSYNNGGATVYLSVDNNKKATDDTIDFKDFTTGDWNTILSKSGIKVYHNTDGTKDIDVKGYCATGVSAGTYNETASGVDLPTIPRKSSIDTLTSSVTVNGTNQVTVTIDRASSEFTHKVAFYVGYYADPDYISEVSGIATSRSYTIPMSWLNSTPNATSRTAVCRVETFHDGVSLGFVYQYFNLVVPSSVIPVVTDIAFSKIADVFSSGILAKGISKLGITGVSVTNQYSATTANYTYALHLAAQAESSGVQYSQPGAALTTDVINIAGSLKLSCRTTDSRGRAADWYGEGITVYDYAQPTILLTGERCDASGITDPNGGYLKVRLQANVSPVNDDNTAVYTLEYKKTTDEDWTAIDISALSGDYAVDASYVRSASASYTWQVRASVTDKVGTVTKTATIDTATVVMDFLAGGRGMGIGKVAEEEGVALAMAAEEDTPDADMSILTMGTDKIIDKTLIADIADYICRRESGSVTRNSTYIGSGASISLKFYPSMKICVMRGYFPAGATLSANTIYHVGTVYDSAHFPYTGRHALSAARAGAVAAKIEAYIDSADGKIYVVPTANLSSGNTMYITGVWLTA